MAIGASSTSITRKVASCTTAVEAGMVTRGNFTFVTSEAFCSMLGAAASIACAKKTHTIIPATTNSG